MFLPWMAPLSDETTTHHYMDSHDLIHVSQPTCWLRESTPSERTLYSLWRRHQQQWKKIPNEQALDHVCTFCSLIHMSVYPDSQPSLCIYFFFFFLHLNEGITAQVRSDY